jgi:hypothetical protein
MRKSILLFFVLLLTISSFGQQTNPSQTLTKQDYLKKSKTQKTAAWICLGSGAVLFAIATPGEVSLDILPALVIGGGVLVAGSIPLFIASGKNKRKAMNISFKIQRSPQQQQSSLAYQNIPAVSINIGL